MKSSVEEQRELRTVGVTGGQRGRAEKQKENDMGYSTAERVKS
jgi:hypothetical protein